MNEIHQAASVDVTYAGRACFLAEDAVGNGVLIK